MGRFLAKAALEILAFKTLKVPDANEEITNKVELDDLRNFARYNHGDDWPFTARTLHPVNEVFHENGQYYELINEFDILITPASEFFSVVSIFGVELVINMGGRELDGYKKWLESNQYACPLYVHK